MLRRSPRQASARAALVAGARRTVLAVTLASTTAYAGPVAAAAGALSVLPPTLSETAPTCLPWQAPATIAPGVAVTPRVFPTDEPAPAPAPIPTPTGAASGAKPRAGTSTPRARVICRTVPPVPFPHPAWDPGTVVGGARLAEVGVVVDRPASVAPPPEVYDVSYVVADLDTGEILAAKSPHAWLRPASTLKALTALTLMPLLDPRRVVTATDDAQNAAGSRVGMLAGNPYPVSSLFDAMLMFSANDAVYALADAAGGYDHTVALMNEKAAEIGAHDTLTVDPSGLDEGDQRSSAYDLALIGRDAMRLPAFRAAIAKRDAVFPGGKDRHGKTWPAFHVFNINELLRHYPGAIGIKPGRTDRAQHTFIGAATRDGRTLIVAQMGSITGSWKPTAALLDWGFANADRVTPVGRLVDPGQAAAPEPAAVAAATGTPTPPPAAAAGGAPVAGAGSDPTAASTASAPGVPAAPFTALVTTALLLVSGWTVLRRRRGAVTDGRRPPVAREGHLEPGRPAEPGVSRPERPSG